MKLSRHPDDEGGADESPLSGATWLYSFADLMTQLLLFSIIMATASGLLEEKKTVAPPDELEKTMRELEQFVKDSELGRAISLDRAAGRFTIRMSSVLLFPEGQAKLTPKAEAVLSQVERLISKLPRPVRVEGHTDDVPISSAAFPSNWELSTARAITVEQYLESRGLPPERLSVAGYGEYHPIVANDSAEHRAMNRRVEIVVLSE